MGFERGKSVKETLRIGMPGKIKKALDEVIEKYMFNLANSTMRERARVELEAILGISLQLKAFQDRDGIWHVGLHPYAPLEDLKLNTTIKYSENQGLRYSEDYTETLTSRSLVTKSYIDSQAK